MNILITSAGRRVSLVKAFQTELKKFIPDGKVFTTDFNIYLSAACHVSDEAFSVPQVADKDYIKVLLQICISNGIKLVIPTIDTELQLLASHKVSFAKKGISIIVSDLSFINLCRDKRDIHKFFSSYDIPVALEYSKYDYKLPLFIKPVNGSRSVDTFLIKNHIDLTQYHFKNEDLMFLEYLDHSNYEEFTCDLYYGRDHTLKAVVPRKRIEIRDGEVNKGITEKNLLVDFIKDRLSIIPGVVGCLTSQFFKHKHSDVIYGIEINGRFGGGFPLTYLAGGNFPKWLIQEYIFNESIDFYNDWEDRLLMLRYDNEILVHDYKE